MAVPLASPRLTISLLGQIDDPIAAARARERRRKMFALTKARISRSPSSNPFRFCQG